MVESKLVVWGDLDLLDEIRVGRLGYPFGVLFGLFRFKIFEVKYFSTIRIFINSGSI